MSIESADNILHVKNSTMRISRVEVGQTLSVGNIEFDTTTTLASVTSNGNNTTPHTISSSNVTTGLVTTANVVVGGELTVSGDATVSSNLEVGTANLFVDTTTSNVGVGTNLPLAALDVRGKLFANTHTGGLTTFLTADYVDNIDATYDVLDSVLFTQTFNIPSEYHSLGTANLEMYVSYRWCGETENIWDASFKIWVINSNGTYYSANNSDQGNRNSGCGVGALSHHADNGSTLDSAIVSSRFYLPNAPVGPGSTFNVQPVISLNTTRRVTTNRCFSNDNTYSVERGTTNFFIVIRVVE